MPGCGRNELVFARRVDEFENLPANCRRSAAADPAHRNRCLDDPARRAAQKLRPLVVPGAQRTRGVVPARQAGHPRRSPPHHTTVWVRLSRVREPRSPSMRAYGKFPSTIGSVVSDTGCWSTAGGTAPRQSSPHLSGQRRARHYVADQPRQAGSAYQVTYGGVPAWWLTGSVPWRAGIWSSIGWCGRIGAGPRRYLVKDMHDRYLGDGVVATVVRDASSAGRKRPVIMLIKSTCCATSPVVMSCAEAGAAVGR